MRVIGMDVGSTTVKAVAVADGQVVWRDYQRHNTKQAEKVLEFLTRMESECGVSPREDRIFFTGSAWANRSPAPDGPRGIGAAPGPAYSALSAVSGSARRARRAGM